MFFYAGHGLQVSGHNYLVPVDAQLSTRLSTRLRDGAPRSRPSRRWSARRKTNILFLDACRDNPLARNLARAMGTRSTEIGRGLAAIESGVGTLDQLLDAAGERGARRRGPQFALCRRARQAIATSTDDLSAILIAVRNDVMKETQRKQVPWEHSALTGRFYFNRTVEAPAPQSLARPSEAAEAWSAVRDSTSVAVLRAFIARYGDTFYAELARARIERA